MITKILNFYAKKPWGGFWVVTACGAASLILLFGFGAYLDSDMTNLVSSILLALLVLIAVSASLFVELLFFQNKPCLFLKNKGINHYFLFASSLVISLFASSLPYLGIYLINPDYQLVQSHWFSLTFPFVYLLLSTGIFLGIVFLKTAAINEEFSPSNNLLSAPQKKDKVNRFLAWFLASFYLLISAQYCFAWNSTLNSFFTGSVTKILYRAIIFVYLTIYCLLLAKVNHLKPNLPWTIAMGVLILCNLLVFTFVPTTISYVFQGSNQGANLSINYVELSIGWINILTMFARFLGAVYVFLLLFSFIRPSVSSRRQVIVPMMAVVALSMVFCIYSLIVERNAYIAFFQGQEVRSQIVSITHSKNALGIFLFSGCFASAFLLKYVAKCKWIFIPTFLLNLVIAFISGCYTAVVPIFLFAVILIINWLVGLIKSSQKKKKILGLALTLSGCIALAVVLICVYTPSIRSQSGAWSRLYNRLSSLGSSEVSSRTKLWTTGLSVLNGPFVFFGKPDQVANVEIGIAQTVLPNSALSPEDFHSAFLSFYSSHGLIGLVIYLSVHAWVFAQLVKLHRFNSRLATYLIILFIGAILFSMPETYTLFISMSAATFPVSLLFICDIDFFQKDSFNASSIKSANGQQLASGATHE
jgi:hypothetical protein